MDKTISYTKQVTKDQLRDVKNPSKNLFKRDKIQFVRETRSEPSTTVNINKETSSFYSELVAQGQDKSLKSNGSSLDKFKCPICDIEVIDIVSHNRSIAHLSSLQHIDSPVEPIGISSENVGYKYLTKYGWSRTQRHGLGAIGKEGQRNPIKVEKKENNKGIGSKLKEMEGIATVGNGGKVDKMEKMVIRSKKDAIEYDRREKRKRRRIMEELR